MLRSSHKFGAPPHFSHVHNGASHKRRPLPSYTSNGNEAWEHGSMIVQVCIDYYVRDEMKKK